MWRKQLSGETSTNMSSLRDWPRDFKRQRFSHAQSSVIFCESTAGPGKTVTLEKLLTESWCKNKYKWQIHLSKTIENVHHDWRLKLFTHRFSDVRLASHDNKGLEFWVSPSRWESESLYPWVLLSINAHRGNNFFNVCLIDDWWNRHFVTHFFLNHECKTSNGFARSCVYNIRLKVTVTLFVC